MTSASPSGRHRHRIGSGNPARRVAARVGQVLATLLSIVVFLGFAYGWYNFHALTKNQHTISITGLGDDVSAPASPGVEHKDGSAQNILVVGVDSRAGLTDAQKRYYHVGQDDVSTSTDTILVLHVPADGSRATLVSIPRDTYVQIPGFASNKINAAYADGYYNTDATTPKAQQEAGASKLVATVKQLTGLAIDHYVQVGFSGFVDIVKVIGSIPITLCESVDDTYAHNRAANIQGASGFKMSAGRHDLDAQQALEFVRQRHNIPGPVTDDLGREERQRYFLRAAFSKIESADVLLNPFKLKRLVTAVGNAFTFDTNNFGIEQFALQMSDLTAGNIAGRSIPTTGSQDYGGSVGTALTVDTAAVQAFVHRLFEAPTSTTHRRSGNASSSTASGSPSGPRTGASSAASSAASSGSSPKASCVY